jgi:hypothetical protein
MSWRNAHGNASVAPAANNKNTPAQTIGQR